MKHHTMDQHTMIIITGPTGVGKTEISLTLAAQLHGEIINADMGQMYQPLTIGTAKPAWQSMATPHHLFDSMDLPSSCTVVEYRTAVITLMEQLWDHKKLPLVVGGSGFYIKSLFFPPRFDVAKEANKQLAQHELTSDKEFWDQLNAVDPERAGKLHPHDRYRVERALVLWRDTQVKPSELAPSYNPPARSLVVHLTRDREELYERINQRVHTMMAAGWLEEARALLGTEWEFFIQNKKIIGYNELINYIKTGDQSAEMYKTMIAEIEQRTRNYAKRQETFWRGLERLLARATTEQSLPEVRTLSINLTASTIEACIETIIAAYKKIRRSRDE